jgi:hypothetical protein
MDPLIEPITPAVRLPMQIIDEGYVNARPEAIFNDPHAALDFVLGLSRRLHRLPLWQKEI